MELYIWIEVIPNHAGGVDVAYYYELVINGRK